ncbi:MAG: hypothetical protein LBT26_00835 [Clostridiales Family XIII bacterium]|jgi:hypothetical protein|nr:hypothetical protein [Clostridiales Family XIII bacterium]
MKTETARMIRTNPGRRPIALLLTLGMIASLFSPVGVVFADEPVSGGEYVSALADEGTGKSSGGTEPAETGGGEPVISLLDEETEDGTDTGALPPADGESEDGTDAGAIPPADEESEDDGEPALPPADEETEDGTDAGALPPADEETEENKGAGDGEPALPPADEESEDGEPALPSADEESEENEGTGDGEPALPPADEDEEALDLPEEEEELIEEEELAPEELLQLLGLELLAEGEVEVSTWTELRAAIRSADVKIISFKNDIARGSSTLYLTEDSAGARLDRDLVINGHGYTLDFSGGGATYVIRLYNPAAQRTLTVKDMGVKGIASSYFVYGSTAVAKDKWTVNLENIQSYPQVSDGATIAGSGAPSFGLVRVDNGTVNFSGTETRVTSFTNIVYAQHVHFLPGSQATLRSYDTTIQLHPTTSGSTAFPTEFTVEGGAKVTLYSGTTQALFINGENSYNIPKVRVAGAGTVLTASGMGSGTLNAGGVISIAGGEGTATRTTAAPSASTPGDGGTIEISGGAQFLVSSNGAQPAFIMQIKNGKFDLTGENTLLDVYSRSGSNSYAAVLRFRLEGGQLFKVSDNAVLKVRKGSADTHRSPAIRFGAGQYNDFDVSGGGKVFIKNEGYGDYGNSGNSANAAIQYDANHFAFKIAGEGSAIELLAPKGLAIEATYNTYGSVDIGPDTIFIAEGRTGSKSYGIIKTGSNFTFTADNPLYYNFQNRRPGGGLVFDVTSTGSYIDVKNSDLDVWQSGTDTEGDPTKSWDMLDEYILTGTDFKNVYDINTSSAGSDAAALKADFNAYYGLTNASSLSSAKIGASAYSRMSGNNAPPRITGFKVPYNTDQHLYGYAEVPEAYEIDIETGAVTTVWRAAFTDEVYVKVSEAGTANTWTVPTKISASLYADQSDTKEGVFDVPLGAFAVPDKQYQITEAWRGTAVRKVHVLTDLPGAVTVLDNTPPQPAVISDTVLYTFGTGLSGTWSLMAGAYNNNRLTADALKVYKTPNGGGAAAEIIGGTAVLTGITGASGEWTYTFPEGYELAAGDKIHVVLSDARVQVSGQPSPLKNENPLTAESFHDATFQAAPFITVTASDYSISAKDAIIGYDKAKEFDALPTQEKDAWLKTLLEAKGWNYSEVASGVDFPVKVNSSNFLSAEGVYTVVFSLVGTPLEYTATAKVRVLPRDVVLVSTGDYIIAANHLQYDIGTVESLISGGTLENRLLADSRATVYKRSDVNFSAAAELADHSVTAATGDKAARFKVPAAVDADTATQAMRLPIIVRVTGGKAPELAVTSPVVISVDDAYGDTEKKTGVTATSYVGSQTTITDWSSSYPGTLTITGNVDTSVADVYILRYTYTDTAGAVSADRTRVVVVNDGTIVVGPGTPGEADPQYIVQAKNFTVRKADVPTGTDAKEQQVLELSKARAWVVSDGQVSQIDSVVKSLGDPEEYGSVNAEYKLYNSLKIGVAAGNDPVRTIGALVINKDVIDEITVPGSPDYTYIIAANNASINTTAATTYAGQDAATAQSGLIYLTGAQGFRWETNTLTVATYNSTVELRSHSIAAALGDYEAVFGFSDFAPNNPPEAKPVITVSDGSAPVLRLPPLNVDISGGPVQMTRAKYMEGVEVTDDKDDSVTLLAAVTFDPSAVTPDALPVVDDYTTTPGAYSMAYSVTDSDGNTTTRNRAIILNDGSFVVWQDPEVPDPEDPELPIDPSNPPGGYILQAKGFAINVKDVAAGAGRDPQILDKSGAKVWSITGAPLSSDLAEVKDAGGYQPTPADDPPYSIEIIVKDAPQVTRTIKAAVLSDDYTVIEGNDYYIISAKDFSITPSDVLADNAALIEKAGAEAWKRVDMSPANLSVYSTTLTLGNTNTAGTYSAIFAVDDDASLTAEIVITVTNGAAPVLEVLPVIPIDLGKENFNVLDYASATDAEDGNDAITAAITYSGTQDGTGGVDVDTVDVYPVTYSVTDNDGNTVTASTLFVVGDIDDIEITPPYIIYAKNFAILLKDVAPEGGRNAQIIEKSGAKIWASPSGSPETPVALLGDPSYTNEVNETTGYEDYPIDIAPQADISKYKGIIACVIDRDNLEDEEEGGTPGEKSDYVIAANNIRITGLVAKAIYDNSPFEYDETDYADAEAALIGLAKAEAWERREWDPATVKLDSHTLTLTNGEVTKGVYYATFYVEDAPDLKVRVTITVDNGKRPTLDMQPLEVTVGEIIDYRRGISARDEEDGDLTEFVAIGTGAAPGAIGALPDGLPAQEAEAAAENVGVYALKYAVTDSDGNTTEKTRAVIINDGTYEYVDDGGLGEDDVIYEDEYVVITGRNFWVEAKDVAGLNDAAYKTRAHVKATDKNTGDDLTAALTVSTDPSSPPATAGADYAVIFALPNGTPASAPPSSDRKGSVTAFVYDEVIYVDPEGSPDGIIITGHPFSVNANAVEGLTDGDYKTLANVQVYKKSASGTPVSALRDALTVDANAMQAQKGVYDVKFTLPYGIPSDDADITPKVRTGTVQGTVYEENGYILKAGSFVILSNEVAAVENSGDALANDANLKAQIKAKSKAEAWDAGTVREIGAVAKTLGTPPYASITTPDTTSVLHEGIEIGIAGSSTEPVKKISALVIDADHLVEGMKYFIAANNFEINQNQVQYMKDYGTWSDLIDFSDAKAQAWDKESLRPADVTVSAHYLDTTPGTTGSSGAYYATFAVSEEPGTEVTVDAEVLAVIGAAPVLTVSPRVVVVPVFSPAWSRAKKMAGVDVTDADSALDAASVEIVYDDLDTDVPGVYILRYEVRDSDNNPAYGRRVVIVNDGSFTLDPDVDLEDDDFDNDSEDDEVWDPGDAEDLTNYYVISAHNFVKAASGVAAAAGRPAQILAESRAKAWNLLGDPATASVQSEAGYGPEPATYSPVLRVSQKPAVVKTIQALVTASDYTDNGTDPKPGDGGGSGGGTPAEYYGIGANDIRLRPSQFDALTGLADDALLISAGSAQAWKLSDFNAATVKVYYPDGPLVKGAVGSAPQRLTFYAEADPPDFSSGIPGAFGTFGLAGGTYVNVKVYITAGGSPELVTPPVVIVPPGGTPDKPSASDPEDGDLTDDVTVGTGGGGSGEPVYEVEYEVTDSDGNTSTETVVVVEDDGTVTVDDDLKGDDGGNIRGYILSGENFVISTGDVAAAAGRSAQIISESSPRLWLTKPLTELTQDKIAVLDEGGYTAAAGTYYPVLVPADKTSVRHTLTAKVKDSVDSGGGFDIVPGDGGDGDDDNDGNGGDANWFTVGANNIRITVSQARNITEAELIRLTDAEAWINPGMHATGVKLASHTIAAVLGEYTATFAASLSEDAATTVRVTVVSDPSTGGDGDGGGGTGVTPGGGDDDGDTTGGGNNGGGTDGDDSDTTGNGNNTGGTDGGYISGGSDSSVPPRPTVEGHGLVAGANGTFIEIGDDGTPLGEWRWDDPQEMWVFEEYAPPLGSLPQTGAVYPDGFDIGFLGWILLMAFFLLAGMACAAAVLFDRRRRTGATLFARSPVFARNEVTKQPRALDCFAALAMTEDVMPDVPPSS